MILISILLILGFILLIKGADFLVDGSSSIAKKLGVSPIVIGLTVVAFGTSAPELVVNLIASISGTTDLAVGNIVGSNIANILLIGGSAAIIAPLLVGKKTIQYEIPFAFLAAVILSFLAADAWLFKSEMSVISRVDGGILLICFALFMMYIFHSIKTTGKIEVDETEKNISFYTAIGLILLGLGGLVLGGYWIVEGAIKIAVLIGVSQSVIGLSIVAIGTSLPELATSIAAARKGHADLAIGNIVGSNIFNIFWIIGISAIIRPLPISSDSIIDFIVMIVASGLLFAVLFIGSKQRINRFHGIGFVLLYVAYMVYLFMR